MFSSSMVLCFKFGNGNKIFQRNRTEIQTKFVADQNFNPKFPRLMKKMFQWKIQFTITIHLLKQIPSNAYTRHSLWLIERFMFGCGRSKSENAFFLDNNSSRLIVKIKDQPGQRLNHQSAHSSRIVRTKKSPRSPPYQKPPVCLGAVMPHYSCQNSG